METDRKHDIGSCRTHARGFCRGRRTARQRAHGVSKAPLLHRCHRHPAHTPPLQDIGGVQRADGRAVVANGTPEPAGDKDRRSLRQRCRAETRERLGYAPQPPEFWHRELPEDTCRAHTIVLAISAARSLPTHTDITHGRCFAACLLSRTPGTSSTCSVRHCHELWLSAATRSRRAMDPANLSARRSTTEAPVGVGRAPTQRSASCLAAVGACRRSVQHNLGTKQLLVLSAASEGKGEK